MHLHTTHTDQAHPYVNGHHPRAGQDETKNTHVETKPKKKNHETKKKDDAASCVCALVIFFVLPSQRKKTPLGFREGAHQN